MSLKYYKYLLLILIFLTPYSILIVSSNLVLPYVTSKNLLFRFFVELELISFLIIILFEKKIDINIKNKLFIVLIIFSVWLFVADLFGINPKQSIFGTIERMDGFLNILHLFFYFFIITVTLKNKKIWINFFYNLILIGIVINFDAVSQINTVERVYSFLGNPAFLSSFALLEIFIAAFLIFYHKLKNKKINILKNIFLICFILLSLYVIFLTETRSALLGLTGGILIMLFFFSVIEKKNKIQKYTSLLLLIFIIISGTLLITHRENLKGTFLDKNIKLIHRVINTSKEDPSTRYRLAIWEAAWNGFKEKPLLGWGQENFMTVSLRYYQPKKLYDTNEWHDRSHNTYLDMLIYGGIPALLLFLILFIYPLFFLIKTEGISTWEKILLIGFLSSYFIKNIVVFDTIPSYLLFYIFLSFIVFLMNQENEKKQKVEGIKKFLIIPLILSIIIGGLYFHIYKMYQTNHNMIIVENFFSKNRKKLNTKNSNISISPILPLIEKTISDNYSGSGFYMVKMINFLPLINNQNEEIKKKYSEMLLKASNFAINQDPLNPKMFFFRAIFLNRFKLWEESEKSLKKALDISPKNINFLALLRKVLTKQGKQKETLEIEKKINELAPKYKFADSKND